MEHHTLNIKKSLNTSIYSYLKTSGSQSSNLYLNVIHVFNTSVNTSVAALDSCFLTLVSNTCYSIVWIPRYTTSSSLVVYDTIPAFDVLQQTKLGKNRNTFKLINFKLLYFYRV
jgi:hypothetical protein